MKVFQYLSSAISENDLFKWAFLKNVYNIFVVSVFASCFFFSKKLINTAIQDFYLHVINKFIIFV